MRPAPSGAGALAPPRVSRVSSGAASVRRPPARLAREPEAALKTARLKLKSAKKGDPETKDTILADARAVELLHALGADGRALLKDLAGGEPSAVRTQEAKRALERLDSK